MKYVQETTIYKFINNGKEDQLNKQISELLSKDMIVLNSEFETEFKTIKRNYGDAITNAALNKIASGELIIFCTNNLKNAMPSYMPFIKYKRGGKTFIAIDVTKYVKQSKDKQGVVAYSIDANKLYCLMVSGYLYLDKFDKGTVLSTNLMKLTSLIWARMFCKVLEMRVGLATNRDRYDAFMYLAIKFFLLCILEAPQGIADSIAKSYFPNNKLNPISNHVEVICEERGINMFADLPTFCTTLFDNSITGISALRVTGSKDVMNYSYYIQQFITLYHLPAALALECFPYFIWLIISASNWGYFFNDKLVQDLCKDETPKIMVELIKMC